MLLKTTAMIDIDKWEKFGKYASKNWLPIIIGIFLGFSITATLYEVFFIKSLKGEISRLKENGSGSNSNPSIAVTDKPTSSPVNIVPADKKTIPLEVKNWIENFGRRNLLYRMYAFKNTTDKNYPELSKDAIHEEINSFSRYVSNLCTYSVLSKEFEKCITENELIKVLREKAGISNDPNSNHLSPSKSFRSVGIDVSLTFWKGNFSDDTIFICATHKIPAGTKVRLLYHRLKEDLKVEKSFTVKILDPFGCEKSKGEVLVSPDRFNEIAGEDDPIEENPLIGKVLLYTQPNL